MSLHRLDDAAQGRLSAEPQFVRDLDDDCAEALDLGKSWDLLHTALVGAPWQPGKFDGDLLSSAVIGGVGAEVKAVNFGYGSPRLLSAPQARDISKALQSCSRDDVARRLVKLTGVAPTSPVEAEALIGDELELFDRLGELYEDAAEEDNAVLVFFA